MERWRLAGSVLYSSWLAFELAMAVVLRERFRAEDWAALAFKAWYLASMLWIVSRRDLAGALRAAAVLGPVSAGLVRATGGWLAYTLFPLYTTGLGALASAYLGWRAGLAACTGALAVLGLGYALPLYPLDALAAIGLGAAAYLSRLYAASTRPSKSL